MVDPTTTNTSMSVPIRGSDVGTWDTPVNGNFNSLDAMMGGVTTVALTSAAVTLTTSQALVNVIRFTGTLNANVAVTLPGIYKSWTIDNQVANSPSSFRVTLVSTSGASIIGCPPAAQDVFYDGTTVKYRNLGRVGEYWDYAASTVPSWVTASTKPPYLNCDGTTFSSATYPILSNLLGSTTLPDIRGTAKYALNQGTARLSTATGGLDGNTIFAKKTTDSVSITLATSNLPAYTPSGTIASSFKVVSINVGAGTTPVYQPSSGSGASLQSTTSSFSGVAQGGVSAPIAASAIGTGTVYGITMIRSE